MVNVDEITSAVENYFNISGSFEVDPETGYVTVFGSVITKDKKTPFLPVHFQEVRGNLLLEHMGLESLRGCPTKVDGNFSVANNQLKSLAFGPKIVTGHYWAHRNDITKLDGIAQEIYGDLTLFFNELTDLKGCPPTLSSDLEIQSNPLISLEGFPQSIAGWVTLSYTDSLPLLRTVSALNINLLVPRQQGGNDTKTRLQPILNQYAGQGIKSVMKLKKDLINAGFEENARW